MLTLPVPLFVALILGFLAIRHAVLGDRSILFLMLLTACALQALLISLTQHYGISQLVLLQPITAVIAPPLAWLTFQSAALRRFDLRRDAIHALIPAFTAFCVVFAPVTLDVLLPVVFAGYGTAILLRLRKEGTLPLARLEAGPLPARIWKAIGILLILSALSDILIAVTMGLGFVHLRPLIISVFTSFTLLGVGLLSLSRDAEGDTEAEEDNAELGPSEEDTALIARLDALMETDQPFLDPDLTLVRLAHRLHVPIKQLSAAINIAKGENVSRYVNGFRIRNACALLNAGQNVTQAMLDSGFNTKSNFNREFARVMGQSPSVYARAAITG
ncbi:helix-turn-helix domain-containing protein [Yoonia sp. F2084L]|uniref:helix-turn-helix domain-containing protein n=1 Tax=Yoonia sp. F2084L TaxID=2926419 RepID=UPI001FF51F15|nr:helix-turn-helix domain-containing protein [Yoonia sp. F2084L]MCK0097457.1 helix-turn-helix domain-containing protein [Yoonia sp. F2084L]